MKNIDTVQIVLYTLGVPEKTRFRMETESAESVTGVISPVYARNRTMARKADPRGFVWYELLLVVLFVTVFILLMIPRLRRTREQQNMVKVQEVLKTIHRKQNQRWKASGRYGAYEAVRPGDLGALARQFDFAVEDVSESTYVAIAREKRNPRRFLSIDQDSGWAGNLLENTNE